MMHIPCPTQSHAELSLRQVTGSSGLHGNSGTITRISLSQGLGDERHMTSVTSDDSCVKVRPVSEAILGQTVFHRPAS